MGYRVFVDANVLVSKALTDWLFLLRDASAGLYSVYTTEDVIAEVLHSMRRAKPQAPGHLTRRRSELLREFTDEIVSNCPGDLAFTGSDPDDYHVHAAPVACRAHFVLTGDSPTHLTADAASEAYGVISPDAFFLSVTNSAPDALRPVVVDQIAYWSALKGHMQLDEALSRAGCPEFAKRVRRELHAMRLFE